MRKLLLTLLASSPIANATSQLISCGTDNSTGSNSDFNLDDLPPEYKDTTNVEDRAQDANMKQIGEDLRSKTIVVYFSGSGNSERSATYLAEQLNLPIFRIERKVDYPSNYSELSEQARVEAVNNQRPELKETPDFINNYEHILLGFPVWWHVAPMVIGSFLEAYNFSGKHIHPFIQSSAYYRGHLLRSLKYLEDNSSQGTIIEKEVYSRNNLVINKWINDFFIPFDK
ncbi:hypothetical protein SCHIN_v1c00470 [Spiroplasma chinense]|uniref:Flavodoxin-like domain-containing protein n=1 Tax=Spiroplasma chinense TaxID=216932 RepID=A0A5B9Y389_9MOLU|nr:flavodoxin [Spiroplasma chinense]QEH61245.1 hypothetical protein SCHIN_v1c00470 [Spiroplasma chinense]